MNFDDGAFEVIRRAALEHMVLRFRGQSLIDPGLIAFGQHFGDLLLPGMSITGKHYIDKHLEILCVSNIRDEEGNPMGNLGSGEALCNQYIAYDTLPDELKYAIQGKIIVHDESVNSAGQTRKGFDDIVDPRDAPGARHPAIRTHPETGQKALYLGRRRNSAVLGIDLDESEYLLDLLWAHATQEKFTWCHEWRMGDVLMWDNRCSLHRRAPFYNNYRRMMHRIQVQGSVPY